MPSDADACACWQAPGVKYLRLCGAERNWTDIRCRGELLDAQVAYIAYGIWSNYCCVFGETRGWNRRQTSARNDYLKEQRRNGDLRIRARPFGYRSVPLSTNMRLRFGIAYKRVAEIARRMEAGLELARK